MAFLNFWRSVRREVRLARSTAIADAPRLVTDGITAALRGADLWLTARVVEDFHANDAVFLPPDERERLTAAVDHFRTVTAGVDPRKPVDATTRELALTAFRAVVELLGFDRYDDPLAFVMGKTIEWRLTPDWPPDLDHLRFRTGSDSTDDPALWVWAFVIEEGEFDDDRFLAQARTIETVLEPIAREVAPEGRLYLTFRSTLDLPERQGVAA